MADYIDMLIEVMRIDCSVVQCYYTNQIDAIFNLFFFPTVFILLVIYLLLNYILDEVRGGLRLLISIALYAVIILNGFMTFFIPLSRFWWIVLVIIFGAWVFFTRLLFKEKRGGSGTLGGIAGGAVAGYLSGKVERALRESDKDEVGLIEAKLDIMEGVINQLGDKECPDPGKLTVGYMEEFDQVRVLISQLQDTGRLGGIKVERGKVNKLKSRMIGINNKFKKVRDKHNL